MLYMMMKVVSNSSWYSVFCCGNRKVIVSRFSMLFIIVIVIDIEWKLGRMV